MDFPDILRGSIWHTTTPQRYQSIVRDGYLRPEPDLPESERWGTAMGPRLHPFVRSLGGVSLFDFREFDEAQYTERYPSSMWGAFVPCCQRSDAAVWIEIELVLVSEKFIDGMTLLQRWKASGQLGRKIMPLIEVAHIGPLPSSAFGRVLVYEKATNTFSEQGRYA
jgi:hypothetical protein